MSTFATITRSAIATALIGFAGLGFAGVAAAEIPAPAHDTSITCSTSDQAATADCAAANTAHAPHDANKSSRRR
jgi:hypothetical protein